MTKQLKKQIKNRTALLNLTDGCLQHIGTVATKIKFMTPCCPTHAPACAHTLINQANALAQRHMTVSNRLWDWQPLRQQWEGSKIDKEPFLVMGNYKIQW